MKPATKTGASDAPPRFVRRSAPRRIVCDHREARSGVPEALARHPDVQLTHHHLSLGDYRVDDTLIVERKTVTDFAQSVRDGRLFTQASRLARCRSARPCLILEGTRITHWSGALPRTALQGAMITVTLIFGIPLLRSSCPEETATLILYAVDQLHRRTINPPKRYGYTEASEAPEHGFSLVVSSSCSNRAQKRARLNEPRDNNARRLPPTTAESRSASSPRPPSAPSPASTPTSTTTPPWR